MFYLMLKINLNQSLISLIILALHKGPVGLLCVQCRLHILSRVHGKLLFTSDRHYRDAFVN